MKRILFPLALFTLISVSSVFSQKIITPISNEDYDALKSAGMLDPAVKYMMTTPKSGSGSPQQLLSKAIGYPKADSTGTGACSCIVPLDATFSIAAFTNGIAPDYRNDDGSTNSIALPFTFCMYGTNYSSIFINNNGNVTFVASSPVFSSTGFPNSTDVMIAPFWADVDTRNTSSGLVHYKVTPTYMIVKWEAVGYYSQHVDKICTFQLIITNGSDPILPTGKNIAFCYGDMNWTTGDASQGLNGFNQTTVGTSSTVGVNKGDGINYIQIGRFGFPGSAYFGPYALNSQIDYLDFKSYYFDVCGTSSNLPPISTTNSACGDTLTICGLSDTLVLSSIFLAPENNQSVNISATAPTLGSNFVILNNSTGVSGQVDFMVIGNTALAGYHTITITATDNGSPPLSTSVSYVIHIVNNPIPDPVITISPQPACASSNPTLTLTNCSSYGSYVWSNGSTSCSFSTTVPGQYFVTVSDSGCYKTSFANAAILANPNPTILGPLNYCNGAGTTLNVLPDTGDAAPYTNIVWNPGAVNNDTLFNALANNYTVTVTDTNGCVGSAVANVTTNPPVVTIAASPANLCSGDSSLLTASVSGATYVWSPGGATTQSIYASLPGVYSVTITANGCSAQNSLNLAVATTPTVTISGIASFCSGGSASLTASTSPSSTYSYSWSNGVNGNTDVVSTGGPITVTVTSSISGCKDTATVNITAIPFPNPNPIINGPLNYCTLSGTTLNVLPAPAGNAPYDSTIWNPGAVNNDTLFNALANTYTLTVTDTNGCIGTATATVTSNPPTVTISASPSGICPGDSSTLTASMSGGVYNWSPGGGTTQSIVTSVTGVYSVTVTTTNGCTAQNTFNLTALPSPTVTISGNTSFCTGSSTTLTAFGAPAATYTFSWSTGGSGSSINVTNSGPVSLYGINNTTGCKDTATVNITANPDPVVTLSALNNNIICSGLSNTITAAVTGGTTPYTYGWTPNVGTVSTVTTSTAGTYSVIVTDVNNCKDTANITLTPSNPNVTLSVTDATICPGQCDTLIAIGSGAPGITYSWAPNFASVSSTVVNCQPGTFKVHVTDANGCKDSASIVVTQNAVPIADFIFTPLPPQQPNVVITFTDMSSVSSGTISQWDWSFGDGNNSTLQDPTHSYSTGGTFPVTLVVVASNGCIDTVSKSYSIDAQVYAPNIITPNGDGKNDALYFKGLEFYPNNRIAIFNRWGQKIYEKDSYPNDWNGSGCADGTYYYILDVPNAKPQSTFTSYFTIIR